MAAKVGVSVFGGMGTVWFFKELLTGLGVF